MSDFDRSEYVRFPEQVKTKPALGSARRMVEAARSAADGKRLGDVPAVTVSQDAFAAAEDA
ncbi:MAG TPA: hypothetical protein VN521_01630, partial [Negativicutes bacterium]|nr:hypothetical protein [Negativicutes bacterium]